MRPSVTHKRLDLIAQGLIYVCRRDLDPDGQECIYSRPPRSYTAYEQKPTRTHCPTDAGDPMSLRVHAVRRCQGPRSTRSRQTDSHFLERQVTPLHLPSCQRSNTETQAGPGASPASPSGVWRHIHNSRELDASKGARAAAAATWQENTCAKREQTVTILVCVC